MDESKDDKFNVPNFNDKASESFHLWQLRMEAILETLNCLGVVDGTDVKPETNDDESNTQEMFDKRMKKAAAIIITGLGDKPLKAVQKYSKSPIDMWDKLSTRYASKTTSNKLSLITEAFGKKKEHNESMMDHIADLETTFTKLDKLSTLNVGQPLNELIQVAILLSSTKNDKGNDAVVAAIRTMDEEKTSWELVTTRLVDEYKEKEAGRTLTKGDNGNDSPMTAAIMQKNTSRTCGYCKKKGHTTFECWKNPKGANYKGKDNRKHSLKYRPRLALALKNENRFVAQQEKLENNDEIKKGNDHGSCNH